MILGQRELEEGFNLHWQVFDEPLNYSHTEFIGPARFTECRFESSVSFMGASFKQGAYFFDCTFKGSANFDWAKISGKCYFWRSRFAKSATFANCVVMPLEEKGSPGDDTSPYLLPGEANFSWTQFSSTANFYRMRFKGPAWFVRPLFQGDTSFEESKFGASVVFYGATHEICLGKRDINPAVFDKLLETGILVPDPETEPARYAHFDAIKTKKDLSTLLHDCGLNDGDVQQLLRIWEQTAIPTLPVDQPTSFRAITFEKPEQSKFQQLNLSRSLFSGSDVEAINFSDVTWARRPVFPMASRHAVYDEESEEYASVQELYNQLEANYQRKGWYQEASDFRYGKMDMMRKGQPPVRRNASILAGYRYLGGYGERYGLALTLLVAFVFVVFPALYLMFGLEGGVPRAVVHSLEVSTFLESMRTPESRLAFRFVEGIERVLVALEVGLFVLAVNRRLGRRSG